MPIRSRIFAESFTASVVLSAFLLLIPAHTAEQPACRTDAYAAKVGCPTSTIQSAPRWRTCLPTGHTRNGARDLRYNLRRSHSRWQHAGPRRNIHFFPTPLFELTLGLRGGGESHAHGDSTTKKTAKQKEQPRPDDDHEADLHSRIVSEGKRGVAQADSVSAREVSTLPDGWIQLFDYETERPCVYY
jgi:hypothetical protein